MKRVVACLFIAFTVLTNCVALPVLATSEQDAADKQAQSFASIWEQSGKKASDYDHTVLFQATAYQGDEAGGGGSISATGKTLSEGMIAVDPNVIPLGHEVLVCGHVFTAEDTGGAIKGAIIDIKMDTIAKCDTWGRQIVYVSWSGGKEPSSPASGTPVDGSSISGVTIGDTSKNATPADDSKDKKLDVKTDTSKSSLTEDDIPGLKKVQDWKGTDVNLADGSDLSSTEQQRLAQWGADIHSSEETAPITFVRACVASVGLMLILYCLFMYLSYWLDRVNNFIDINFLGMLSYGRLGISPDDVTSTFTPSNHGLKLVVHSDMVKIVLVGLGFGVLILSGKVYTCLAFLLSVIGKIKDII